MQFSAKWKRNRKCTIQVKHIFNRVLLSMHAWSKKKFVMLKSRKIKSPQSILQLLFFKLESYINILAADGADKQVTPPCKSYSLPCPQLYVLSHAPDASVSVTCSRSGHASCTAVCPSWRRKSVPPSFHNILRIQSRCHARYCPELPEIYRRLLSGIHIHDTWYQTGSSNLSHSRARRLPGGRYYCGSVDCTPRTQNRWRAKSASEHWSLPQVSSCGSGRIQVQRTFRSTDHNKESPSRPQIQTRPWTSCNGHS